MEYEVVHCVGMEILKSLEITLNQEYIGKFEKNFRYYYDLSLNRQESFTSSTLLEIIKTAYMYHDPTKKKADLKK